MTGKSAPGRWATLHPFEEGEGGGTLGRKVANTGFLRAFLRADPFDFYHFFLPGPSVAPFADLLAGLAPDLAGRNAFVVRAREDLPLAVREHEFSVFHLSDFTTDTVPLMRLRNALAKNIFPITGLTHSLSYERFMPAYLGLLSPCTTARDSVICTSQSARAMLTAVFAGLRQGYGLAEDRFPAPRLSIIPLGVDLADFPGPREWARAGNPGAASPAGRDMRRRLGIREDETVFLCLARISPHSKMDVLPVIAAFRRAAGLGLDLAGCCLILAGWAEDERLPQALADYAAAAGVRLIPAVRPSDEERRGLYAIADCFLSPSDNIQETFGLTILEAGASGLPVIASNFNGYRDLVAHDETGILVPCLGPACTPETNALAGIWMDNQYHLRLAQETVADVPLLAEALARLGQNPGLRMDMGLAGRRRVTALYAWETVIEQYCGLWEFLAGQDLPDERTLRRSRHPLEMDFAASFAAHFSSHLDAGAAHTLMVRRTAAGDALYKGKAPPLLYAGMEHMIDPELLRRMLLAARKPIKVKTLLEKLDNGTWHHTEEAMFLVLWALKQDYLERAPG